MKLLLHDDDALESQDHGSYKDQIGSMRGFAWPKLLQAIECADAALATLIARDSRRRKLCLLAGERHLVIFAGSEGRFRKEVRKLGYSLPGH